jgi:protocatechuate 3,4-dioxygenase alpha subunit
LAHEHTPSQTVGPFFAFGLPYRGGEVLVSEETQGERIRLEGRVLDGAGVAIPDALIEIWQANAAGRYDHPDDNRSDKPLDPAFHGFGRCPTDKDGRFRFLTIKPGAVPGTGNSLQAPHINVAVFARGLLKQLWTRIYFEGEPLNADDPVLALVDAKRRKTLIAKRANGKGEETAYVLDFVLQGSDETVFFDV